MEINKYILVVADYDDETLNAYSLNDVGEVHRHFEEEIANKIIKEKKYKGVFEEALLLEVDVDSYFKGKGVEQISYDLKVGSLLQNRESKKLEAVTEILVDKFDGFEIKTQNLRYNKEGWYIDDFHCSYPSLENVYENYELVGENFKLFKKE